MSEAQRDVRLQEIAAWENQFFLAKTNERAPYEQWLEQVTKQLDEEKKQRFFAYLDDVVFRLHAAVMHSKAFDEAHRRIVQTARIFEPTIREIDDFKKLPLETADFIAEQMMAKQRLLAFGQGSLTGVGGLFFLALDLPVLAAIQLQSLQQLALIYGFDPRRAEETEAILKIFHLATLPKRDQRRYWDMLWNDLNRNDFSGFAEQSLEWLLKQIAKSLAITFLRKKLIQGVPLLGIAVGAGMNYRFAKEGIELGQRFYQKRKLLNEN